VTSGSKKKNKRRNALIDSWRRAWRGSELEERKVQLAGAYYEVILGSGGLAPGVLHFGIRWGGWSVSPFGRFTAGVEVSRSH
jgi:hypothetical protein